MNDCYLNGDYLPLVDARVSPLDRGFLFGDAVYELIAVYAGVPGFVEKHYQRLCQGLTTIGVSCPLSADAFAAIIDGLIENTAAQDSEVYLQITRGVGCQRGHAEVAGLTPTVFAMIQPHTYPSLPQLALGCDAVTHSDQRWLRCGEIKNTALLANVLALLDGKGRSPSISEVILIDQGLVQEGCSSAVAIQQGDRILFPPLNPRILRSITRDVVTMLAQELGLSVDCAPIPVEALYKADNVWLLSTKRELWPVARVDGNTIADGKPSALWQRLYPAYRALLGTKRL